MKTKFLPVLLLLSALLFSAADAETHVVESIPLEGEEGRYLVQMEIATATPIEAMPAGEAVRIVSEDGTVLVSGLGDMFWVEEDGVIGVKRNGRYGYLDPTGAWLIEPRYYEVASFSEGFTAAAAERGTYGYIGPDRDWVIKPRFTAARAFTEGRAVVEEDGLWGIIDTGGNYLLTPQYKAMILHQDGTVTVYTDSYGKKGILDRNYELIGGCMFDAISWTEEGFYIVIQDGLCGTMDAEGSFISEPRYALSTGRISYGFDILYACDGSGCEVLGFICNDGTVVAPKYDEIKRGYGTKAPVAVRSGDLWGFVSPEDGTELTGFVYDDVVGFRDGVAWVCQKTSGWQMMNEAFEVLTEPEAYDEVYIDFDGIGVTVKNALYGFVLPDGTVFAPQLDDYLAMDIDTLYCAKQNGLWGIVDIKSGIWSVPPEYGFIYDANDRFISAAASEEEANYWWRGGGGDCEAGMLYAADGTLLLEGPYDDILLLEDGTVRTEKDGIVKNYGYDSTGTFTEIAEVASDIDLTIYAPFTGERTSTLGEEADLVWDEDYPLPRIDGVTALFPVYAAYAQAVYPEGTRYKEFSVSWSAPLGDSNLLVTCSKTNAAYDRLIAGYTDVIFCAGPSEAQVTEARLNGKEFELTPIGSESFVFIVNAESPVTEISTQQIRQIFSGELTSWSELGAPELGDIVAYQRPENSGSQTALEKLMGDTPLMQAPEYVTDQMVGMVDIIEYRNLPNAIGYSFRFFVSGMMESKVRMLAVDGIAPTKENIANGMYPHITALYAVTLKGNDNPNVRKLLDWVQGPQGQALLEMSGYVALDS